MILPDVNVLVYAFRPDSARHEQAREWLGFVVNGLAAYAISPQVLSSLIRITTHPRIFRTPSALAEAIAFCQAVIAPSHCGLVLPGPRHWEIFTRLCTTARATGNMVPDAWFAALAIEAGCEWITTDRDYARFEELRWRDPLG
ncbi:MAG TPA: type II toxin-antitoxin system VapC family toxin [Thermoanaerobaculia bacterium]|nr:type II toxin-antitoxin system VapC family toxin [Thermoanaerobaculia bacterium]